MAEPYEPVLNSLNRATSRLRNKTAGVLLFAIAVNLYCVAVLANTVIKSDIPPLIRIVLIVLMVATLSLVIAVYTVALFSYWHVRKK